MTWRHAVLATLAVCALDAPLAAQQRDEQFYYPGQFNWQFLKNYPEAAKLFNAFDYGHAVLYERLFQYQGRPGEALEQEYQYLTTDLLIRPPQFAIAEEAVMPRYAKVAWRAKQMFDWAHILHRQIYDVYADERLTPSARDTLIEHLTDYYLARKQYAFAAKPKSMALMDDQYFSQVFRKRYEKFNGLIWSYHWLQVGLYEPLIEGETKAEKKAGVQATVARFWSMLADAPSHFPRNMPMTPAIAPKFTAAHPRAAIIFDNLHMTHDIISDILSTDTIGQNRKAAMINEQLDMLQDTTRDVITRDDWRNMHEMMGGIGSMGGPATNLLKDVPASSMTAGGMAGMQHGMAKSGAAAKDTLGAAGQHPVSHAMPARQDSVMAAMPEMSATDHVMDNVRATSSIPAAMRALHDRMMRDPIIRQRMMTDTVLRRLASEAEIVMSPAQPRVGRRATPQSPAVKKPAAVKPAAPKALPKDSMKSMPGMKHP